MYIIQDAIQKKSIISLIRTLNNHNRELINIDCHGEQNKKNILFRVLDCLRYGKIKSIKGFILDKYSRFMINRKIYSIQNNDEYVEYDDEEFFCESRIAVYTAIFGMYESLHEPEVMPDNVDYFVITDCPVDDNSRWKIRDVIFPPNLNPAQKNRYVKMHSHLLFPEYKYSVYVDGSVQIISDLTPLVHKIGVYGFAMHIHSSRDDLFDELLAAKYTRRITNEDYRKYTKYFQEQKMPRHYGLVECGVIARDHHNELCPKIMDQWWQQYLNGIKRDQICLAYILFKNHIKVKEIGTLGYNIYKNCLFKILIHR